MEAFRRRVRPMTSRIRIPVRRRPLIRYILRCTIRIPPDVLEFFFLLSIPIPLLLTFHSLLYCFQLHSLSSYSFFFFKKKCFFLSKMPCLLSSCIIRAIALGGVWTFMIFHSFQAGGIQGVKWRMRLGYSVHFGAFQFLPTCILLIYSEPSYPLL